MLLFLEKKGETIKLNMNIFDLIVCWITWNVEKKARVEELFEEFLNNPTFQIIHKAFTAAKNGYSALKWKQKNFSENFEKNIPL